MLIKDFRQQLIRGLGSALLFLKENPAKASKYRNVIYDACIRNTAYDPQCEASKDQYLWEVIQLSGAAEILQRKILDRLTQTYEGYDLLQMYRLAKIFSLNGNSEALQAMEQGFKYNEEWNCFIGAEEIIEAAGEHGVLFIANEIGKKILSSDYWEDNLIMDFAKETMGEDKIAELFGGKHNENIRTFVDSVAKHTRQWDNALATAPSYEGIKESIRNCERPFYKYTRWGVNASEDDIQQAAADLLKISSNKILIPHLHIFAKRVFPLDPSGIVSLARSKHHKLRSAAIDALRNVKYEQIREVAIELLNEKSDATEALELLINNYHDSDYPLIEKAFFMKRNKHSFHDMGFVLLKIIENNPTTKWNKVLVEFYKKGFCTYCRKRCLEIMIKNNLIPQTILEEIKYDSNVDIRKLAMDYTIKV